MVTTTRSYGSSVSLYVKEESSYGVSAGGNFEQLPYQSHDFGGEQGLIQSNVLGLGREPRAPFTDILRVDGPFTVPVDVRDIGFWLTQLLGAATVTTQVATGTITFADNPTVNDTITINGIVFTFVASAPGADDITIGSNLSLTLDDMISVLNGHADVDVDDATYTEDGATILTITHDTSGVAGNTFTLAASADTVSAATLLGGAYVHTFSSGVVDIPSFSAELAHSSVPSYLLSLGCRVDSVQMNFQRTGGALATFAVFAQDETRYATTQAGTPTTRVYETFNQFQGSIKKDGTLLGNVTGAQFTYGNGMERVETIRSDDKIEAVDPTQISSAGSVDVRYGDNTLLDVAIARTPFEMELGYTINAGKSLLFTFHEVYLSRPKVPVSGPGGVQSTFNWEGAYSSGDSASMTCVLKNDVASY